jgi:hypothetical protein
MDKYKVEYISSEKVKSKWFEVTKSHVDSWTLAKELEALLVEYDQRGYKVLNIESIVTPVALGNGAGTKTDGLLVVFEKKKENDTKQ